MSTPRNRDLHPMPIPIVRDTPKEIIVHPEFSTSSDIKTDKIMKPGSPLLDSWKSRRRRRRRGLVFRIMS